MNLPLHNVKIADFSWVGAGPRATKDLADFGATVIKIESANKLDLGRMSPPFANDKQDPDGSTFFAITNTSKLSVTINLNDPDGIDVAKKLVAWADVVVENFSPGYMERIGLSYEVLKDINPDIIVASVSVAGRSGPLGNIRGYGNSAAALSGMAVFSGWPDRDPHIPPYAYGDVVAPMFMTVSILAALEHKRATGEGQYIDVSQVEPLVHTLADVYARYQHKAEPKTGNRKSSAAPHGVFPSRGRNQFIAIAVFNDAQWKTLAALIGYEEGLEWTLAQRKANEDKLESLIAAWTSQQDKHVLAEQLQKLGISAEAVADGRDVFTDPELLNNGHFRQVDHKKLGRCDMPAPPLKFSAADIRVEPSPCLGEHLYPVLVDMLGIPRCRVDKLVSSGALV